MAAAALFAAVWMTRLLSRMLWALRTFRCDCHWHEPYGRVVMAGCPRHD